MTLSDWTNVASIVGFVLAMLAFGLGEWRAHKQGKREEAADEQRAQERQEDKDDFERQLKAAKETSDARFALMRDHNDILKQTLDAQRLQALQSAKDDLDIKLQRQTASDGKGILVAEITNRSTTKPAEVRNIEIVGSQPRVKAGWTTLHKAREGNSSGLPDGMALDNAVSFTLHPGEVALAYFAHRIPDANNPTERKVIAPDYHDKDRNHRFALEGATNVEVRTRHDLFVCPNPMPALSAMAEYVKQVYQEGQDAHQRRLKNDRSAYMKGYNVPHGH